MLRRLRLAIPLALTVFLADCASKDLAEAYLVPEHVAHPVVGNVVRFTLAHNHGAAMSIPIGPYGMVFLIAFTLIAVAILACMIWETPVNDAVRRVALGMLLGGALGNFVGRAFSHRGVVDFIDVGIGARRFYVFNVADVGITCGLGLLAFTLYRTARSS